MKLLKVVWFYLHPENALRAMRLVRIKIRLRRRLILEGFVSIGVEPDVHIAVAHGSRLVLGRGAWLRRGTEIEVYDGATVTLAERCFFNRGCIVVSRYGLTIGPGCMFGDHVSIYDHNHSYSEPAMVFRDQGYRGAPIVIGANVWLGSKVFVGPGVTIGDNVIVGAHTLVLKDIPARSIAHGQSSLMIKTLPWPPDNA